VVVPLLLLLLPMKGWGPQLQDQVLQQQQELPLLLLLDPGPLVLAPLQQDPLCLGRLLQVAAEVRP